MFLNCGFKELIHGLTHCFLMTLTLANVVSQDQFEISLNLTLFIYLNVLHLSAESYSMYCIFL